MYIWGLLGLLPLAAGLTSCKPQRVDLSRYVHMYPSAAIVMFSKDSTTMTVTIRNVSGTKLTGLRLVVKTEACTVGVIPRTLPAIIPGDRRTFTVTLHRKKEAARKRYPLLLTLHAPQLPAPAGLDLMVDLSLPVDGNWIDVGQVTLVAQSGTRTVYYLLAGVPLLFLLGWMLWRWSRPKAQKLQEHGKEHPAGDDPDDDEDDWDEDDDEDDWDEDDEDKDDKDDEDDEDDEDAEAL